MCSYYELYLSWDIEQWCDPYMQPEENQPVVECATLNVISRWSGDALEIEEQLQGNYSVYPSKISWDKNALDRSENCQRTKNDSTTVYLSALHH